jgi:hypothetical protein
VYESRNREAERLLPVSSSEKGEKEGKHEAGLSRRYLNKPYITSNRTFGTSFL